MAQGERDWKIHPRMPKEDQGHMGYKASNSGSWGHKTVETLSSADGLEYLGPKDVTSDTRNSPANFIEEDKKPRRK